MNGRNDFFYNVLLYTPGGKRKKKDGWKGLQNFALMTCYESIFISIYYLLLLLLLLQLDTYLPKYILSRYRQTTSSSSTTT